MVFKPAREKLNAHFEGYKLGKQSLQCVSQSFEGPVRVARLKEDDYSYQHVRAFTLCNHLTVDTWDDGRNVYWCTDSGTIFRGRYTDSNGVKVSPVFKCPAPLGPAVSSVNPSLAFISAHHCLFATGCDSTLYLLYTPSRVSSESRGSNEVSGNESSWLLLNELNLPGLDGKVIHLLSAHYSDEDRQLDVATMIIHSTVTGKGKGRKGKDTAKGGESKEKAKGGVCNEIAKPPIATYHWYRLDTDLVSLPTIDSTPLVKEPLVTNVCSLQSSTVPLCGMFAYGHLVILSEADVVSCVDKDKRTDDSNSEVDSATENVPQGHQVEETEEEDSFAGLGFTTGKEERSTLQLEYQTEGDVTVTVALPDDVTKRDVHCVIERRMLVVGLTDGTTYFRGHLFAPVTPDCSTWTIENHRLEVTLEKERGGLEWPSLREKEGEGAGREGMSELPLREPVLDQLSQEELEELKKKLADATKNEDSSPAPKRHHSLVQGTEYEECDFSEEDSSFYIISHTNNVQKVPLAGRQFLFSSPSRTQNPPVICLKHDVDAVLWQPQAPPFNGTSPCLSWAHIGTFNALAYVQAARQDKKFTACPPNMRFATLCDCSRHVFVYMQPEEGVKGNTALQYVTTMQSAEDILGLQATNAGLVFVLKESELHVIVVS